MSIAPPSIVHILALENFVLESDAPVEVDDPASAWLALKKEHGSGVSVRHLFPVFGIQTTKMMSQHFYNLVWEDDAWFADQFRKVCHVSFAVTPFLLLVLQLTVLSSSWLQYSCF